MVVVLWVGACGRPLDATESTVEAMTSTTLGPTTTAPAPTLGVTRTEFLESWNSIMRIHPSLVINEFDVETETQMIRGPSDAWQLKLSVSPQSGDLIEAQLRGSLDGHTDQNLMLAASWVSLVGALNGEQEIDLEDWDRVMGSLGLKTSDSRSPKGLGEDIYSSEAVIDGVLYTFEKVGFDTTLTARPSP